jgi:hypothetical protein
MQLLTPLGTARLKPRDGQGPGHFPKEIRERVVVILNTPGIQEGESDLLLEAFWLYAEKDVEFADAFSA